MRSPVKPMAHKSFSIVASVGLPDLQGALSQNRHLNVTKIVTCDSYGALDFRGAGASGFAFIGRQLDPAKNENSGAFDEKAGAVGSIWDLLRDTRAIYNPEVIGGISDAESSLILRNFFKNYRS